MSRRAPISMNPAPAEPVTSEQLAPPPGSQQSSVQQQGGYPQGGYQGDYQTASQGGYPGYDQQGGYQQQGGFQGRGDASSRIVTSQPNNPYQQQPAQPAQPAPSAVATAVAPPAKEDVLGQWTIADASSSCQLNVSLTGWNGGYRASTRNCTSEELKRVGAWNIEGNNVVLKDQGGKQVAVLARSNDRRFDGALAIGGPVAMLR